MALTITARKDAVIGGKRAIKCNVAFDNSYPTGGEAFTPGAIGLSQVDDMYVQAGPGGVATAAQSGHSFALGGTSKEPLILAYATVGTEAANTANLSTVQANVIFLGS